MQELKRTQHLPNERVIGSTELAASRKARLGRLKFCGGRSLPRSDAAVVDPERALAIAL
jgi:hypothetical protein